MEILRTDSEPLSARLMKELLFPWEQDLRMKTESNGGRMQLSDTGLRSSTSIQLQEEESLDSQCSHKSATSNSNHSMKSHKSKENEKMKAKGRIRITLSKGELSELISALRQHTLVVQSMAIHSEMFEGGHDALAAARAEMCFNLLQRLEKMEKGR